MIPRHARLAHRQLLLVLTLALCLGTAIAAFQVVLDYRDQLDRLEKERRHLTESVSQPAANALWELNDALALSIIDGMMAYEPITVAELTTTTGQVLAGRRHVHEQTDYRWLCDLLFAMPTTRETLLRYHNDGATYEVGSLTVLRDPCPVSKQFYRRALVTFLSGLLKSVLLSLLLFGLFYLTLTRPLASLAAQMRANTPLVGRAPAITVAERDKDNELGQIAEIVTAQTNLIRQHLAELETARQALGTANQELESTVVARTADLTREIGQRISVENQLRMAAKDAYMNADARGRFLANMSHELRTPLNAILGFSDFALHFIDKGDTARVREYLGHINHSGARLLQLVNNILDLSRIDSGRMPIHFEDISLADVIDDTVRQLEPLFAQNGNTVDTDNVADVMIVCDAARLRQVLTNLIGNATKYTQNGGIKISAWERATCPHHLPADGAAPVGATEQPRAGRWISIAVRDTGIGIAKRDLERIFDVYAQSDGMMSRDAEGSGLGLTIVRATCELLGWDIQVESTVGAGSCFTLSLPVEPASDQTARADRA